MNSGSLNKRRDAYVRAMRILLKRFDVFYPLKLKGILGRQREVLGAQIEYLEDFAQANLDSPPEAPQLVELLLRVQHLPRMILSYQRILATEEKNEVLKPIEREALTLAHQLGDLLQAWALKHHQIIDE